MTKSEPNLQAIRAKLQQQQSLARTADDWSDWPQRPLPRHTQLSSTVEALQQRSQQPAVSPPNPSEIEAAAQQRLQMQQQLRREQLQQKAAEINALSAQQEQMMLEMQTITQHWQRETRQLLQHIPPSERLAHVDADLCSYGEAVLAWVATEADGCYVLTHRGVDFQRAEREAGLVAQHLRQTQPGPQRFSPSKAGLALLWQEPLEASYACYDWLMALVDRIGSRVRSTPTRSGSRRRQPRLTLLDVAIWFGSGLVSRLALNNLLAVYAGIGPVAVAIVTAITAYALYRALLSPRADFGLAYRVFIAIFGLIVGGHL